MNPFSVDVREELYCLTSGKKVNDDIKSDLLGFIKAGEARADEFTKDCLKLPLRFEKPIKRKKVKNFASASVKSKLPAGKTTQEVAGRLLLLSTLENIDLEKVLKFPLTPVPLSLSHSDGSMNNTDKSKLMHKLETFLDNQPIPTETDVFIVDAVFFHHQQKNLPVAFGELAKCLLRQLVTMFKHVHLVCDTYISPSIIDIERERRGNDESAFNITGPDQTRPKDWQAALRSSSFKKALFMFLVSEWGKSEYVTMLKDCFLYLAVDNGCVSFKAGDGLIQKNNVQELQCDHEEADTRMVFHLEYMSVMKNMSHVVIRSCDTDVLVILCYYLACRNSDVQVWMDVGRDSNDTRRYISVNTIVINITKEVARALPGLHAITGCVYVPAVLNKGKAKPFELVSKIKMIQECMTALGENEVNDVTTFQCEAFVCALYGQPDETSVDRARFGIFQKDNKKVRWIACADGNVTQFAVKAGYDTIFKCNLYVCIASVEGEKIPGQVVPSHNCAFVTFDGKEVSVTEYDVLIDPQQRLAWKRCDVKGAMPRGTQVGGYDANKLMYFIARGKTPDGNHCSGKYVPQDQKCYFAWQDQEMSSEEFDFLCKK